MQRLLRRPICVAANAAYAAAIAAGIRGAAPGAMPDCSSYSSAVTPNRLAIGEATAGRRTIRCARGLSTSNGLGADCISKERLLLAAARGANALLMP